MITQLKRLMLVVAALAVVAVGCGPKIAPPTSVMDTPEYHYKNGLKYLDNDQIDDAMKSFDRAIALAPKSPLGYIGKGLAFGKKGDFKAAFENMDKAKGMKRRGSKPVSAWSVFTACREVRTGSRMPRRNSKPPRRRTRIMRRFTIIWGRLIRFPSTSTSQPICSARFWT
jgi:hypothetical protein